MRQSKTTKKAKGKHKVRVRDLKPARDTKGGQFYSVAIKSGRIASLHK